MTPRRKGHRHAGFTLVELLVSSSVMVFILAGAYLCLESGLESQRLCERRMDIAQTARVALSLMAADLRNACPLDKDFEFVGMDRMLGDMEADNLDFATHNWRPGAPGEGDFCEISYFVDRNPRTGEFSLWRRRDPSPDEEPLAGGFREEIAPGLVAAHIEYYDGYSWYDSWGRVPGGLEDTSTPRDPLAFNLSGLPDAVKITLAFTEPGNLKSAILAGARNGEKKSEETSNSPDTLLFQAVVRLELAKRANQILSVGNTSGIDAESTPGSDSSEGPGDAPAERD